MTVSIGRATQLREYLRADPGNVVLACDLLDELVSSGAHVDAERLIEALPAQARAASGIQFRSARCALILGRYAEAAAALRALINEGQENVALWHDLAFCYLCMRDADNAVRTLDDASSRFGASAELAIVRARVALMKGDFAGTHAALGEALVLSPDHSTALGLRALALLDAGDAEQATRAAEAALIKFPGQHEALLVAGTTALWRQELDRANGFFELALERHPNSGRALSGDGQLKMLRQDLPAACERLQQAVAAMPDHIGTWHALAWVHLLCGDIDAAESAYQSAYDLDRNFADSHGGLALIHALKLRIDEAEQAIKRALRLDAHCVTALYAQSLILSDAGRNGEAEQILSGLLQHSPVPTNMAIGEFAGNLRARFVGIAS